MACSRGSTHRSTSTPLTTSRSDLIFLLLAPESAGAEHLKALARVSRLLRDKQLCDKLRGTDNAEVIYALLTEQSASHAA